MSNNIDEQLQILKDDRSSMYDHKKNLILDRANLESKMIDLKDADADQKQELTNQLNQISEAYENINARIEASNIAIEELKSSDAQGRTKMNTPNLSEDLKSVSDDFEKSGSFSIEAKADSSASEEVEVEPHPVTPEAREQLIDAIKAEVMKQEGIPEALEAYKSIKDSGKIKRYVFYIHNGEPIMFAVPKTANFAKSYSELDHGRPESELEANLLQIRNGIKLAKEYMVFPAVFKMNSDEIEDALLPGFAYTFVEKFLEASGWSNEVTQPIEV